MKFKKLILILVNIFLFSVVLEGTVRDAGSYLKKHVVTSKLSNGITVMMLNRGNTPTLAFIISFKVGSVDESYRNAGMAHMLEHMLFKGTDTIGTRNFRKEKKLLDRIEAVGETLNKIRSKNPRNQMIPKLEQQLRSLQKEHEKYVLSSPYSRTYSENGGVGFNAFTSRDRTAYVIELPASKLELWARLESERLQKPVMREFYRERDSVLEERLMRYESSGIGSLYEKFIAHAFVAHPYRHPTIGWKSNIQYYSLPEVRKFYAKYYVPERMTIAVIGKQDTEKTVRVLERFFGRLPRRVAPGGVFLKEPPQKGERRFVIKMESNPYLILGWHKPTVPSRDDYVCDVISSLLSEGKTSRLYRHLVLNKKMATAVDSSNGQPGSRYDNLFMITAAPKKPYTPVELEKEIYAEIERLKSDCTDSEFKKVLNRMEASMVFGLNTNMGVARLISYYQTVFDDWQYVVTYMDELRSITKKDVTRVLNKYFHKNNRTVGILLRKKTL